MTSILSSAADGQRLMAMPPERAPGKTQAPRTRGNDSRGTGGVNWLLQQKT